MRRPRRAAAQLSENVDAPRARELAQAMRIGIEDLATIPVVFAGYNWGARRDRVTIEPNVLGFTQALLMRLPAR